MWGSSPVCKLYEAGQRTRLTFYIALRIGRLILTSGFYKFFFSLDFKVYDFFGCELTLLGRLRDRVPYRYDSKGDN